MNSASIGWYSWEVCSPVSGSRLFLIWTCMCTCMYIVRVSRRDTYKAQRSLDHIVRGGGGATYSINHCLCPRVDLLFENSRKKFLIKISQENFLEWEIRKNKLLLILGIQKRDLFKNFWEVCFLLRKEFKGGWQEL